MTSEAADSWLGELPAHWDVRRLKFTVERSDVRVEPGQHGRVPYVGLEHVASQTGHLLPFADERSPEGLSNTFAAGDVLFGKLRPYLAKAFCADFGGICSTEFLVLRPVSYAPRYLLHLLLTDGFVALADSATFGARMPRASWEFIGNIVLPVPPMEEQQQIAAFLDRETGRIDELVQRTGSKDRGSQIAGAVGALIERLQEYRAALISAAVTGKIDMREPAPQESGSPMTDQTAPRQTAG